MAHDVKVEWKIASRAGMLGLTEEQYSAPQAERDQMLMGHFRSKSPIKSCRFAMMHPAAYELRIGVELGVRAQCVVK